MPYKHGRPVIDLSLHFRIASFLCFHLVAPIAYVINFMMFFTRYKNRYKLKGISKAITVSNHATFLDPVYPGQFVQRDEKGKITPRSINEFAESVRQIMQEEIDTRKESEAFYRGPMKRIKGLNDDVITV